MLGLNVGDSEDDLPRARLAVVLGCGRAEWTPCANVGLPTSQHGGRTTVTCMRRHRLLSEVVAALLLVWLLASCSPGEEDPTPAVRYSDHNRERQ